MASVTLAELNHELNRRKRSMNAFFGTRFLLLCITALLTAHLEAGAAENWRQFRGDDGSGISSNDKVPLVVDPKQDALWRTETPGQGWSSPVSDGKVIWMTAAEVTEATEQQRADALRGVSMAGMKDVAGGVELLAIAIDAATGKLLHRVDLGPVDQPKPIHPMNGYASPTPAISGNRVVVDFGQYGTWCLDVQTGEVIWKRKLIVDDSVGPGSSPVIFRDKVILTRDGMDQQYVEALRLSDGNSVWKTQRPPINASNGEYRKSYSTPLLVEVAGVTQAVVPGAQWCVAYNAETGEEIWKVDHADGFSVTPMPTYANGRVIFSTGFMRANLYAIDPTGAGNVTDTHVSWVAGRGGSRMASMVHDGNQLYSVSDDGILTALRLEDGSQVYRTRLGGKFSASLFRVGDQVWLANHSGEATVFRCGSEFEKVGEYSFDEQVMASPIVIGDDLLIRTSAAIYRFSSRN